MSAVPLVNWDHSLFEELQHLLARVATQPTTSTIRRLYAKLEDAQPWLLSLTQLPRPNEEDKKAVEKNPVTLPNGASVQFVGEILKWPTTISDVLNTSQLLSAVIAIQADSLRHRFPSRSVPEIAIFIYHNWLSEQLDFLRELLRLTIGPDAGEGAPFDTLRNWVGALLDAKTSLGTGKSEGTLVDQIIGQLDELQSRLGSLLRTGPVAGVEYELLSFRVGAIRAEQNKLAGILAAIAEGGYLGRGQVIKVIKWLKKCDRVDGLVGVILSALYAATRPIDSLEESDPRFEVIEEWCRDVRFIKLASSFIAQDQWTSAPLRDAVKLSWFAFYISALRNDPAVAQTGIDPHQADQFIHDSIAGDLFHFLRELVMSVRRERGWEEKDERGEAVEDALVQQASRSDPANDDFLFSQLQELVDAFAGRKQFLRNLRNREEDVSLRRSQATAPPAHFQAFLGLLAAVYKSLPPDRAEHLWDNTTFTGAVLDARGGWPGPAFWEMLVAISAGPICAAKSFEKMKDTRLNWSGLFKFYQHYYEIMPRLFEPIKTSRSTSVDPMSLEEVETCKGWTEALCTVVRWSNLARNALLQTKPYPLQMLFDFVNSDIPVDLKATIFEAITAFCTRTGDGTDDDVLSKAVDAYERISFTDAGAETRHHEGARFPPPIGWMAKMEYSEQDILTYPLTRAYLSFLSALLPSPSTTDDRPIRLSSRLLNALRRGLSYILDRVLLVPNARRYARDGERWELLDSALAFLEKALLAFNMSELLVQSNTRTIGQIATVLADEPGFAVMLRLLSEPGMFDVLASVIDTSFSASSPRPAAVNSVLSRTLRIIHRVLDIQLVFSDVLLLTLSDPTRSANQTFRRPMGMQSLDQHMLNHLSCITAIALFVGDDDLSISFTSTKIVSALANSAVFSRSDIFRNEYTTSVNRLAGIIDASDESIRIAQGFCSRLEGEGEDLTQKDVEEVGRATLNGDVTPANLSALPVTIRSTILDLLLEGTSPDAPGPNLAHFLLGFDFRNNDFTIQDPRSPDSRLSCLQSILRHLGEGSDLGGDSTTTLLFLHPLLAVKSAQIVNQLFGNLSTGRTTMAYAMSVFAFTARQLVSLPRICPPATRSEQPGSGTVATVEGEVATTADICVAFLDYQRDILSCVALETFTFDGHSSETSAITQALFGAASDEDPEDTDLDYQRPALIIDLLSSIDMQWKEDVRPGTAENRTLEFYTQFDFDQFKRTDADWWDLKGLTKALHAFRRQLESQGAVTAGSSSQAMATEATFIVERLGSRNRETEISLAKGSFLTAWSELLKTSLAMLFRNVPEDRQDIVLFELLDAILDRIVSDMAPGVLDIMCEAVLVSITTLVNILAGFEGVNLPVDRLSTILRKMIDAATRPGTTENARGNLFASISQYLQLLSLAPSIPDDATIAASTIGRESTVPTVTTLHRATIRELANRKDRLIPLLCRDAMDDRDVWKTECFALLGGIVSICHNERDQAVLSPLSQSGALSLFVKGIKDREMALQECLSPEAGNLHAFWVYEAKIAFLLTIASSRKGAEELLDAGVFEVFSMCTFIAVQPIGGDSHNAVAFEEAITRQHRVLICALQLLARTLSSLHKSARSGAGHAISFMNAHKEALLVLLRENQQYLTLTGIDECHLLISILGLIVHKVPSDDLRSPSGFGAFHMAVLALAARYFDRQAWGEGLSQDEITHVEPHILSLNQVTLAYLCATTAGLKAGSGFPVLVNGASRGNGTSKFIASAPSITMMVDLLSDLADAVQELSSDYELLQERVQDGGEIDEDDLAKLASRDLVEGADGNLAGAFIIRSCILFNMIESSLLLTWRHLLFYANDALHPSHPVRPGDLSQSFSANSVLDQSRSAAAATRSLERVAGGLRGVMSRLEGLGNEVHVDLRKSQKGGYHGMLLRRLNELCAGLVGERENGGMEED